jgi:hypothetical protein
MYTKRFQDDLSTPGLRVPLTSSEKIFTDAVRLGRRVIWLHTFGDRMADTKDGRPPELPRLPASRRPHIPIGGAIPTDPDGMPDTIDYDAGKQRLLVGNGYVENVEPAKGIDILAHNDPLGTSAPRIKVQVKRRADKINVDGLRAFMALLGEQDVGIFVSTGGFTSDAQVEARTKETRKLTLIDLEKLVDLWIEHYDKVSESDKRLLPLKPIHYLAPTD